MMGELMLRRRKMEPRGKRKAQAVLAMTAWAMRTRCLRRKVAGDSLNGADDEAEFGWELSTGEEPRHGGRSPDHWGEAVVVEERRVMMRRNRNKCIVLGLLVTTVKIIDN
jgi:hypothetical protein